MTQFGLFFFLSFFLNVFYTQIAVSRNIVYKNSNKDRFGMRADERFVLVCLAIKHCCLIRNRMCAAERAHFQRNAIDYSTQLKIVAVG